MYARRALLEAKLVCGFLHSNGTGLIPTENPKKFEAGVCSVWRLVVNEEGGGDPRYNFAQIVNMYRISNMDKFDAKLKSTLDTMAKNENWGGCYGKIDMDGAVVDWGFAEKPMEEIETMPGGGPWLVNMRRHAWRAGSLNCGALPGIPCAVEAITDDIILQIVPIPKLMSHGVALTDVAGFLESATGTAFFKEFCAILRLAKGSVCYVPPGCMVIPTATSSEDDETKDSPEVGVVWTMPIWSVKEVASLDAQVVTAISAYNSACFSRSTQRIMAERAEAFAKFMVEVTKQLST